MEVCNDHEKLLSIVINSKIDKVKHDILHSYTRTIFLTFHALLFNSSHFNRTYFIVPRGKARAVLCPINGEGSTCPMIYKTLNIGQGKRFLWWSDHTDS